jgi:YrbI family 3-deoxy-D-manno-octulosonate 8-phosphate phosphatase
MVSENDQRLLNDELINKILKIKFVLTDNDGVLTDTGVYYSSKGEELKKYSIRDGMGVERLKKICGIKTGIISGEKSKSLQRRAQKLEITELYLGVKDKMKSLKKILNKHKLTSENIAYIGDDVNDLEVLNSVGFSACPKDAILEIRTVTDYICNNLGGHGAFREMAELIISIQTLYEKK